MLYAFSFFPTNKIPIELFENNIKIFPNDLDKIELFSNIYSIMGKYLLIKLDNKYIVLNKLMQNIFKIMNFEKSTINTADTYNS